MLVKSADENNSTAAFCEVNLKREVSIIEQPHGHVQGKPKMTPIFVHLIILPNNDLFLKFFH